MSDTLVKDEEGIIVKMSRQACNEAADLIEQQSAEIAALKAECIRVCELRFQATNEIYYITYNAGVRDCIAAIKDLGTSHE